MGLLVARRYPTAMMLGLADHTYVECGTGQVGWGCWGGKTGGDALRGAMGSTSQADAIAESDERGGIKFYLINGVCHQSANRIMFPSGKTVDGAKGYDLSVVFFTPYGRPKALLGLCQAPFHENNHIGGDLTLCLEAPHSASQEAFDNSSTDRRFDFMDTSYMSDARSSFESLAIEENVGETQLFEYQMWQFKRFVLHKMPRSRFRISPRQYHGLMSAREEFEIGRLTAERQLAESDDALTFVNQFNELTLQFQENASRALEGYQYLALLDLSPDERIVLADPDIVKAVYEPPTSPRRPSS